LYYVRRAARGAASGVARVQPFHGIVQSLNWIVESAGITEPATMVTDYLLSGAAAFFAARLRRSFPPGRRRGNLWVMAFLTVSAAALAGGTMHGFALYLGAGPRTLLWNVTVALIALGAGLFLTAALSFRVSRSRARWLLGGLFVSLAGVAVQQSELAPHPDFNHNDVYHCIQIVGLYLLYRGASGGVRDAASGRPTAARVTEAGRDRYEY